MDIRRYKRVICYFPTVSYMLYIDGGEYFEKGVQKKIIKKWALGMDKEGNSSMQN